MKSWKILKWFYCMEQEYNITQGKNIAIIGAGASGCLCTYFLLKAGLKVTLFDFGTPLRTLLPTGGGRCNLAHAEYDFKELAKNYPRGEKFLYSVFSKFGTYETIDLFDELGIETYTQDNGRIFPASNSSVDVQKKILNKIKGSNFIKEKVIGIFRLENGYKVKTNKAEYFFSSVIIAVGGNKFQNQNLFKNIDLNIIPFTPSLVGLNSRESFKEISGIVIKNAYSKELKLSDDLLFTHFGISGPLAYKISSYRTKSSFPYKLTFDLYPAEFDLQNLLNENPHKEIKNIISTILPTGFVKFILKDLSEIKAHKIDGKIRDFILGKIHNFEITISGTNKGEETVSAGGIDLNEINPKTMEAKKYPHLYFIGECLNIDGLCGGFNLQNAWATAFVAAAGIISAQL